MKPALISKDKEQYVTDSHYLQNSELLFTECTKNQVVTGGGGKRQGKKLISDQGVRAFLESRPSSGIGPWLKDECGSV